MLAKQMCEYKHLIKPDGNKKELKGYINNLMMLDLTRHVKYEKTVKVVGSIE